MIEKSFNSVNFSDYGTSRAQKFILKADFTQNYPMYLLGFEKEGPFAFYIKL